jgi:amidase
MQEELMRILLVSEASRLLSDERFQAGRSLAQTLGRDDTSVFAGDLRASVILHRDWLAADEERHAIRARLLRLFEDYDAIVCPVSPVLAPFHPTDADRYRRVADDGSDTVEYFAQMTWSGLATITYLPASVAPVGRVGDLPLGLQVIGPPLADLTTVTVAETLAARFSR